MRLSGNTTEREILEALRRSALDSWGASRAEELDSTVARFAHAVWVVMQVPLQPLSEPPDIPVSMTVRGEER